MALGSTGRTKPWTRQAAAWMKCHFQEGASNQAEDQRLKGLNLHEEGEPRLVDIGCEVAAAPIALAISATKRIACGNTGLHELTTTKELDADR